jgi:hypothetical protein
MSKYGLDKSFSLTHFFTIQISDMRKTYIFFIWACLFLLYSPAQSQLIDCINQEAQDTSGYSSTAFFNYGSLPRVKNQKFKTSIAVGQTFIGFAENVEYSTRFLLPPFKLKVQATQGDLLDRIQLTWEIDDLGPQSTEGFNIYRDDIYLATVGSDIRNYNDFNVIAGKAYTYNIRGINAFGEGANSEALGFQVPNGVVTGWVRSINDSPVPDALVTLMPMQGYSAHFDSLDNAMSVSEISNPFLPDGIQDWTVSFWVKNNSASENSRMIGICNLRL